MSETKPMQTQRQSWEAYARDVQQDVDSTLERAGEIIDHAHFFLEQLQREDTEAYTQYAREVVEELDELWSHHGDLFFVSGHWHAPDGAHIGFNGFHTEHNFIEASRSAHSAGFIVKPVEINGVELPRIGMSFCLKQITVSYPMYQAVVNLLAFAELKDISLQYMRPDGSEVVSSNIDEVVRAMLRANSILREHLASEDSAFYQASAENQRKFIDAMIESCEQTLPKTDTLDRLDLVRSTTQHVFINNFAGDQGKIGHVDSESPIEIVGRIEGFSTLDIIQDASIKQYRRPEDIHASDSGLCVLVSPNEGYMQEFQEQYGSGQLVIPVGAFKDLKLVLQ